MNHIDDNNRALSVPGKSKAPNDKTVLDSVIQDPIVLEGQFVVHSTEQRAHTKTEARESSLQKEAKTFDSKVVAELGLSDAFIRKISEKQISASDFESMIDIVNILGRRDIFSSKSSSDLINTLFYDPRTHIDFDDAENLIRHCVDMGMIHKRSSLMFSHQLHDDDFLSVHPPIPNMSASSPLEKFVENSQPVVFYAKTSAAYIAKSLLKPVVALIDYPVSIVLDTTKELVKFFSKIRGDFYYYKSYKRWLSVVAPSRISLTPLGQEISMNVRKMEEKKKMEEKINTV